jgi:hypothetical protein
MNGLSPSQIALPLAVGAGVQRIVVGNGNAAVIEALQVPDRWPWWVQSGLR